MSKSRIGLAILMVAAALASTTPASARIRIGGPLGVLRFAISRAMPGVRFHGRHARSHVRYATVRDAANAPRHGDAPRHADEVPPRPADELQLRGDRHLEDPTVRTRIAAAAALAGWHGGRSTDGWWRHGDGGYGWVGPLFWPFAYFDLYGYAIGDEGAGFRNYGYEDIYAGIFAPYGSDDLNAYLAQHPSGHRRAVAVSLTDICGEASGEAANLPVDRIRAAIQPTDAQRARVDDLAKASIKAAQTLTAACPAQVASTAPARLAAMEQRLEAMIAAVEMIRPPLEDLTRTLDDGQKARLDALADDGRKTDSKTSDSKTVDSKASPSCGAGEAVMPDWPTEAIESALHPTDAQRAALKTLQDAATRAGDMLKAACQENQAANDGAGEGANDTPVARFEAIDLKLDAMLQAVRHVHAALDDLFETLSDEQKAQFETIGPKRAAS